MELRGPYRQEGPYPPGDYCGYEAAYQILLNSLNKGRINPRYTQWNKIRHLRAAYGNQIRSSSQGNQLLLSTDDAFGTYKRIGKDPCDSLWFHKFMRGYHNRMGDEQRTNRALSIPLLKKLIRQVESNIAMTDSPEETHRWVVMSAYIMYSSGIKKSNINSPNSCTANTIR